MNKPTKTQSDQLAKDTLLQDYLEIETSRKAFNQDDEVKKRINRWLFRVKNFHSNCADELSLDDYKFIMQPYKNPDIFGKPTIQYKYQLRALNVYREMIRVRNFYPEVMDMDNSYKILDLSAGGCGNFEVVRRYNNESINAEYFGELENMKPIHDELGVDIVPFDGQITPYPFEDKSVDILVCNQAINIYGPPRHWEGFVEEMCRIARKKVVLTHNDVFPDVLATTEPEKLGPKYKAIVNLRKKFNTVDAPPDREPRLLLSTVIIP